MVLGCLPDCNFQASPISSLLIGCTLRCICIIWQQVVQRGSINSLPQQVLWVWQLR